MEENGVPGENQSPTCRKLLTNFITKCCIDYTSPWTGFELTTCVVIGADYTGSCNSNYHMTTTVSWRVIFHGVCFYFHAWFVVHSLCNCSTKLFCYVQKGRHAIKWFVRIEIRLSGNEECTRCMVANIIVEYINIIVKKHGYVAGNLWECLGDEITFSTMHSKLFRHYDS